MGGMGLSPISQRVTVLRATPISSASRVCDQPRAARRDLSCAGVICSSVKKSVRKTFHQTTACLNQARHPSQGHAQVVNPYTPCRRLVARQATVGKTYQRCAAPRVFVRLWPNWPLMMPLWSLQKYRHWVVLSQYPQARKRSHLQPKPGYYGSPLVAPSSRCPTLVHHCTSCCIASYASLLARKLAVKSVHREMLGDEIASLAADQHVNNLALQDWLIESAACVDQSVPTLSIPLNPLCCINRDRRLHRCPLDMCVNHHDGSICYRE